MKNNNISKIVFLFISSTIGAGFASGKEIYFFFTNYKFLSYFGLLVSGIMFILIGIILLDSIRINKILSFDQLLANLFPTKVATIISFLATIFMVGVFSIMISGMANILMILLNLNYLISTIISSLLSMIILIYGINGIIKLSNFVAPLLIVGIIILSILFITRDISVSINPKELILSNWFISSILYICYNIIICGVVLTGITELIDSKKTALISGIISGLILFIALLLLNSVLLKYYESISNHELPMLLLSFNYHRIYGIFWSILIFIAMLTTAISSAYGCVMTFNYRYKINKTKLIIFLCFIIIPITLFGFSNLISIIYPIFGYIGLIFITTLIYKYFF